MAHMKLGKDETITIQFGGYVDSRIYLVSRENIEHSFQQEEKIKKLEHDLANEKHANGLLREASTAMAADLAKVRKEIEEEKIAKNHGQCGSVCCSTIMRLKKELMKARAVRVDQVAPLYIIDADLADRIRSIVGVMKPEWRGIETAPRDGTYILAAWIKGLFPVLCAFNPGNSERGFVNIQTQETIRPTHWMPLPEPPK